MQKVFMVLFGVLLLACGEDRSNSSPTIISILFQEQAVFPSKIVEIIPLETRQDALIGLYYSVLSTRDYFIVHDQKKVIIFNKAGKIHAVINRLGKSNSEYLSIADVTVYQDTIYVKDPMRKRLMRFNLDGEFVDNLNILSPGYQFGIGNGIIYSNIINPNEAGGMTLQLNDFSGELISQEIPFKYSSDLAAREKFVRFKDKLYYVPNFYATIFELHKDGSIHPYYTFDFGNKWPEDSELDQWDNMRNTSLTMKTLREEGKIAFLEFHEISNTIALCLNMGSSRYSWFYDKQTERQFMVQHQSEQSSVLGHDIFCTDGDAFVTSIDAFDYLENYQELRPLELSADHNPVLVVYTF